MGNIELAGIDWIVLLAYLAAVAAVGIAARRRVTDTEHYFMGARRFGKWVMVGQSFATGTHAEMPVSLAGAVYTTGASAIWYQWKNLFATPFYWLLAPLFRRMRRTTTAEAVEDRFGPWMGAIYTVFALSFFTINMASMLKGAAKVISQAAGSHVPVNGIVVAMVVIFIGYSYLGGLVASAWADLVQGFLILALSFMLIPLGWGLVGGMAGLKDALPAHHFSLATPRGIGPWFIFMLTLNGLVGITAQPHVMASVGTGKDERACRVGFLYGNMTKRVCTIGWTLVGLIAAALLVRGVFGVRALVDPEEAFGFACRHLLFRGGVGLLIACILAANMAGCSAFMVDSGALFTQSFYRKYVARGREGSHYLAVGRMSGVCISLIAVAYALFFIDRVLYSFLLTETMATFMGIAIVGGIIWPRANRWGALASLLACFAVNFTLYAARHERLDSWHPNVFAAALLAGIAALLAVSLVTAPERRDNLQSFYERLQRPIFLDGTGAFAAGDVNAPAREAAKTGHQLIVPNLLQLRRAAAGYGFLRAYRQDLGGFAAGCAAVCGLVALMWLILQI